MSKLLRVLTGLFLVIALVVGCSSGSGSSGSSVTPPTPAPPTTSTITGIAANSAIHGADIRIFQFGPDGSLVEVTAVNAPVKTSADGSFVAEITVSDLFAGGGPLVITTTGGTMNAEAAPRFAAVVADSSSLSKAGSSIEQYLTVPTSVAAELLQRDAIAAGDAPLPAAANSIIARVEAGLGVSLSENPMIDGTSLAFFNNSIDANLNLIEMPQNNPAVDDLISYLVLNFSSSAGAMDTMMMNPADESDRLFPATFNGVGTGALANLVPAGPMAFLFFDASMDKTRIENDGMDTAVLAASLMDATGSRAGTGMVADVHTMSGRLVISSNSPRFHGGEAVTHISSVWPGEAEVMVGCGLPAGTAVSHSFSVAVADDVADVDDTVHPRVVSAGSTGNTEVLVSFSEAMRGGIESVENPDHYRITATESIAGDSQASQKSSDDGTDRGDDVVAEKPEAIVTNAELILPDRQTVRLTTMSQSDLEYEISVTNVTDLAGNSLAAPDGDTNPSSAIFQGTPPSGNDVVDTDGDGLSDADEQRGWVVISVSATGVEMTFEVTSDPTVADTDGDGISDSSEFQGGMNPRTADSDGDMLTDYEEWHLIHSNALHQDTDGDGLEDGFEYKTLRTSPILADTDGDQLSDPDEVAAGNRNPLIADLPSPRISIGNVNLQLDTRFSFTSETGESVEEEKTFEAAISRGEDETFSTSNQNSTRSTLEFSQELQASFNAGPGIIEGVDIQTTVGSKQGSERGNTFTVGEQSSRSSEETYHDSLTTTTARDMRESVTREVEGAAMKVDVSIDNVGDLPFTISNLELSAQVQDPLDRRRMIPVAALVPENQGLGSVNIGALGDPSRGPFVFNTVSVFPQQVQELMKNPRGLLVQLANFDITDNEGNNFAFTSQEVLDRTAGVTFDLGDGRVESYRVATASSHDPGTGRPAGVAMAYVFDVIGLQRYATIRDGGNGIVETVAVGDDESSIAVGSAIEPGSIIVKAGNDGVLASTAQGDDQWVRPDYETKLQRDVDSIRDGGNGIAETTAVGDDVQQAVVGSTVYPGQVVVTAGADQSLTTPVPGGDDVLVPASVSEHRVLTRFRDVAVDAGARRFWALFQSRARPGVDLENYIVRAGEQFDFTYVQDKDNDGVWAREEFMHGSSDFLPNTDGCDKNPAPVPCDTLTDKEEIQEGWRVQLRSSPQGYPTYSNPNQGDSDRDYLLCTDGSCQLTDDEERACGLDPRQRDTDLDGLTDWEELNGKRIVDGVVTDMVSRNYDTNAIVYSISPYDDPADVAENYPEGTVLVAHDVIAGCTENGYATDPLNADTDGDLVSDSLELMLGLNPNDSQDGPTFLDDDGDGVPNSIESIGWMRVVNASDSDNAEFDVRFTSNPNVTDTDNDLLPDLLEYYIGSNPIALDTDGDGITDTNEYKGGGEACVTKTAGEVCILWADKLTFTFLEYLSKCSSAAVCNNAAIEQSLLDARARGYGTNASEADSDFDTLEDLFELTPRYIKVNDAFVSVVSDPLTANSDEDLLDDGEELVAKTDPKNADTDGDGTSDHAEAGLERDPTITDKRINITVTKAIVVKGEGEDIDPRINAYVSFNNADFVHVADFDGNDIDDGASFGGAPKLLSERVFTNESRMVVKFSGYELDDVYDDPFSDVTTIVTIDTSGSTGEKEVTLDMTEPEGDNKVSFVLTVREITPLP